MRNHPDLQSLYSHVLSPIPIEDQRQISGILCMLCLGSYSNTRWRQQERGTMKTEISTAAAFVTKLLKTSGLIEETQLQQFCHSLQDSMRDHYKHHWFPQLPCRGSGYRCLRINHKMDPLIGRAACHIGLSHRRLFQLLPSELTLWVDPFEVSYRIGEDGSICVLYEGVPAVAKSLEAHSSCKDTLRMGRDSPTKNYNMMTVSS